MGAMGSMPGPAMQAAEDDEALLIAGAGIGGLTAARALERLGIAVRCFERAPELREVGAGITVQANAMLALRHLDLEEPIRAAGQALNTASIWTAAGRDLGTVPLEELHDSLGATSVILHRSRLQSILHDSLERTTVELGRTAASCRDDEGEDSIRLCLEDGGEVRGRAILGCDGQRSAIRRALFGEMPLRYSGYTTWRGVARGESAMPQGTATEIWGRHSRFGLVPMAADQLYWYAAETAPAGGTESPGHIRASLDRLFADYPSPVAAVLAATPEESIVRTDVFDLPPSRRWHRGRVALAGDAIHPMEPNLGQGGGQAIEDAVVLAHCVGRGGRIEDAFAEYERRRARRAAWFVDTSRSFGLLTHRLPVWTSPLRDLLFSLVPTRRFARRMADAQRFEL